ncbi:hypothetical protein L3Q82_021054, partial [Scortum barcoo]
MGVMAEVEERSPVSTILSAQGQGLTFEQQKELLLMQMEHEKRKHELEIKKQIEVERIRQETEKSKLDLQGYRLSLNKSGKVVWGGSGYVPEHQVSAAFPLKSITTKAVVKALTQFISVFGIPKIIQSDRGSNFSSHMFGQVLKLLRVKHNQSSAYHAQSQGALERFHQTLKSLLRAYCTELDRDWEEGLPWLMLAAREAVQESTGFAPNELVFGHTVRGPLALLKGNCVNAEPPKNLVNFVNGFRHRLFLASRMARENLQVAQDRMKKIYVRHTERQEFSPGGSSAGSYAYCEFTVSGKVHQ